MLAFHQRLSSLIFGPSTLTLATFDRALMLRSSQRRAGIAMLTSSK